MKLLALGLFAGGVMLLGTHATPVAADCGNVKTSVIGGDLCNGVNNSDGHVRDNAIWKLLLDVINILSVGVGLAAIGGLVWGSILWTSAGGDSGRVKKAREVITNVVIGLIAYAAMFVFLNFIIPGGVF